MSFLRTESSRVRWSGMMNVRPTYRFFTSPSRYGRSSSPAISIALGLDPSGTGSTTSISHSRFLMRRASLRPSSSWNSYTEMELSVESGRAR